MRDVKAYRPQSSSISSGQVLHCPYTAEKARLVVQEMADLLALELVEKGLVTDAMVLTVGYDIENLRDARAPSAVSGRGDGRPLWQDRCRSTRTAQRTLAGRRLLHG